MFRMICVEYIVAICEKVFINLWILRVVIRRSWGYLVVLMCIVPLNHKKMMMMMMMMMMMGSSVSQHSWERSGWRMAYLSNV
jgi:hypothetical protein